MVKRFLIILLCFMLAACERQPDAEQLHQTLEQKLADTFGPDLFKIVQLTRRGSAVDSTAPPDETRRVV